MTKIIPRSPLRGTRADLLQLRHAMKSMVKESAVYLLWPLFAFLVLLAINVGISLINLGPFSTPLAIVIATLQAGLIAVYFMNLRRATHLILIFASASLIWLFILFALSMTDYLFRRVG
jgi:cytochrome c oxidase subunit 4